MLVKSWVVPDALVSLPGLEVLPADCVGEVVPVAGASAACDDGEIVAVSARLGRCGTGGVATDCRFAELDVWDARVDMSAAAVIDICGPPCAGPSPESCKRHATTDIDPAVSSGLYLADQDVLADGPRHRRLQRILGMTRARDDVRKRRAGEEACVGDCARCGMGTNRSPQVSSMNG